MGASRFAPLFVSSSLLLAACDASIDGQEEFKDDGGPGLVAGERPALAPIKVGELTDVLVESPRDLGPGVSYTEELFEPGATFIKVHFSQLDLAPGDELLISDGAGNVVERLYHNEGEGDIWAIRVLGDTALVTLNTGAGASREGFVVDQLSKGLLDLEALSAELEPTPFAICGADDKRAAACFSGEVAQHSQAVGQMSYTSGGGTFVCTGSLISSENHFITNNHCISNQAETNTLEVSFNFQRSSCNGSGSAPATVVRGGKFLKTSVGLDYTLVQLNGNPAATFGFLEVDPGDVALGTSIYIPQHPSGRRKEIAASENGTSCTIKSVNRNIGGYRARANLGYTCDTEGGSSGSPVLSATTHKLIALHHLGGCNNSGTYMRDIYPEIADFLPSELPTPGGSTGQGFFLGSAGNTPRAIPDNNADGISSVITVPSGVVAGEVQIEVDIQHTFRGDLVVGVIAPTGHVAMLTNRAGQGADHLVGAFDVTSQLPAELPASGDWTLRVLDHQAQDVGTLRSFALKINEPPAGGAFVGQNTNAAAIPDGNTSGITSTITIPSGVTVQSVEIEVNITHTWRGDLEITLTSPSGQTKTALARTNPNDSRDNVVGRATLSGFSGSASGTWSLRVRDLEGKDTGTLNFWKLALNSPL